MVTKTKRVLALVLTAMMASTALAGCAGNNNTPTKSTTSDTASTAASDGASTDASVVDGNTPAAADVYDAGTMESIKAAMAKEAEANGGTIKLEVWCSGDDAKFEKTRKKAFEEKFADSRYKFDIKINSSYGEDKAGGKIIESPKDGADVFSFADDQLSTMVSAKALAKVGELFQANVVANNDQAAVEVCSQNGVAYAFPKTSDNGFFMYYDKRVFPTEADVTELDKMIETANSNGKSVYLNISNAWYNAAFYFAAGCEISYKDGKQTATFNTPEGFNAAKAMCHVAEKIGAGFVGSPGTSGDNAVVQQGFTDGKLAAAVIGTWEGPAIKEAIGVDNVGAAKLPTALIDGKQVQLHSFGGYKVVGVNAFSKFPVSAQTFAYFVTDEESQLARYDTRGLIPTNKKALESDKVKDDPALKAIQAQAEFAHAQGQCVSSAYWSTNVGGFGGEIATAKGNMSDDKIKESLEQIVTQIEGD